MILGIDPGVSTGIAMYEAGKLTLLETIHPADLVAFINEAKGVVFGQSPETWIDPETGEIVG
jgi:predicted RNase H-like nuclease (RuvC/YqgF family)